MTAKHERQQLREATVAMLTGKTAASTRVNKSRMAPVRGAELPTISVYTDDEPVEPTSRMTAPRVMTRQPKLAIAAWVAVPANGELDDAFDAIALEIETAIDADLNFDGCAFDSVLFSTEMGIKMDGERPMGCVQLTYAVTYKTQQRTAVIDAARDDFDTMDVKTSLGGAQAPADQAEHLVENIHE